MTGKYFATEENASLILAMAKRQYKATGQINVSSIQESLFGNKGGIYHMFTCKVIDDAGLPRTKRLKLFTAKLNQQTKNSQANGVSLQKLQYGPESIVIDPQGVRTI